MRMRSAAACDSLVEAFEVNTTTRHSYLISLDPLGHAEINVTLDADCFNTGPEQQIAHLARCLRLYGFLLVLALARVIPRDRYNCRGTSLQLTASYVTLCS